MNTTLTVVSTDPTVRGENIENERFVTAALGVFDKTNEMNLFPSEFLLAKFLPWYKTKKFQALQNDWDTVREVGLKKIYDFVDRYDRDELYEMEKASYLAGAIERQRESNDITRDEMAELCLIALFVGVDTTSSVTAWNLLHLALNPECQEKLHAELLESLNEKGSNGGTRLNADVIGKKVSPYLHMCFRESHRATPAFGAAMWKGNSHRDVEIHGETLPQGSMVQMGHVSYDEEYIDEPKQFRPERWTAEGVASRKGTKSEVLDHPFLRDPFSQGARKCPGSRVATNEILAMISQLVLDWKISVSDESIKSLDDIKHEASPIKPVFPALSFEARR
jgi:cytochrome P450